MRQVERPAQCPPGVPAPMRLRPQRLPNLAPSPAVPNCLDPAEPSGLCFPSASVQLPDPEGGDPQWRSSAIRANHPRPFGAASPRGRGAPRRRPLSEETASPRVKQVAFEPTQYEYKTAERLKRDYWLYAVFNCGAVPQLHAIQDPARLGWEAIVKVEHYHVSARKILEATDSTKTETT